MDNKNIKTLQDNIISINLNKEYNNSKEYDINCFNINKIVHKYSNTSIPLYRFFYNEELITKNNNYVITYKCINCESIHKVALNNIIRKINRNIVNCRICKELDEIKRINHSNYMIECKGNPIKKKKQEITLERKIDMDKDIFSKYDDDFKDNYFRRNMTYNEFEYLRKKIKSIQNGKFILNDDLIYCPTISMSNQTRFSPYLYSITRKCLEKIHNITIVCDNCDSEFTSKNLHSHKNKIKALCKDCNLTNNVFKIRMYQNLSNEKIMYQSKFELKFIRYCNENKIYLINGAKINYNFKDKKCTYKIDFAIPRLKLLVEIKDNHIWHKEQENNGKWDAKVNGVNEFLKENSMYTKFLVIFPKNYLFEMNNIISNYWKNNL